MTRPEFLRKVADGKNVPPHVALAAWQRCQLAKRLPAARRPAAMREIVAYIERESRRAA